VAAWADLETEYINRADRVIAVSPQIGELLVRDHQIDRPVVVMNVPPRSRQKEGSIREAIGLAPDVPLMVYSGGVSRARGIHTAVEALGKLDGVHLALVIPAKYRYVLELERIAAKGDFADRLHTVPYVEPQDIVPFLQSATLAVSSFVAGPINHEVTIPNKVFDYMHARLPIVISDCRAMAELVKGLGIGEVYTSEDVDSLTTTARHMLANLDIYRAAYESQPDLLDRFSWRNERRNLFGVYRELLGDDVVAEDIGSERLPSLVESPPEKMTRAQHGGS
jgi:glycosyltransferase involved in cell wall biosynthesis